MQNSYGHVGHTEQDYLNHKFWGSTKMCFKELGEPRLVAHTFNPSTVEAEADGSLSSKPAWSTVD